MLFEYSLTPASFREELIWPPKHTENKQQMIKYSRFQIQSNGITVNEKMIVVEQIQQGTIFTFD